MATLTGQTIAATYDALLKVTDNGPITSSLKLITDGLGNNTALSLSSSAASITGTLSVTSTIGASNLSGTNTGDETNATIKTKLGAASASQDGYLTSTDWSTFNNKVPASRTLTINGTAYDLSADRSWTIVSGVSSFNTRTGAITLTSLDVTDALGFTPVTNARTISTTAPLSGGGDLTANRTLSISQATTSTNGYLSSTDWNTFNNKQNALTNPVTGTGTTNYVAKFTGSTSIGNSLIYDNGTNVGIGIASPFGRFHSLSTGTGSNAISGVFSDGSTNGNAITISNATGLSTISATYLSTAIDSALAFQTTTGGVSSERIRITAAGSVGIGTTSPSATLDVNGSITSSTNVRALRFWGGPSVFTTHSAPLHIFSSTIGTGAIARFNNNESTDASTLTSMWLENYAGYRAEIAYTTHLNGSNIYINNTYNSGNILFSINSSEKARILNTGQFKLNGYTSTSSFTGTAAGYLAFDSSGNILTTAAPSGGISGSGTTNYVPKFSGSTSIANSLIYDTGTAIGIGTTSPSATLDVYKASGETTLQISAGSEYARLFYRDSDDNFGMFINGLTRWRFIGSTGNAALLESGSGNVAIGTTAATATTKLWVNGTGYFNDSVGIGTTSLTGYNLALGKTITGAGTSMAVYQNGTVQSDVTSSAFGFRNDLNTQAATFTLPVYTHYQAQQGTVGVGTTLTTQIGFNAGTLTGGANVFGFRGQVASTSGRWNLYMDGTANNYLNGALGISATSLAGFHIHIGRTLTGAVTSRGIHQSYSVGSDVTNAAIINSTSISTQAAAFTLPQLTHYYAGQVTIGAGSTVTNQNGFRVDNTLIGATNNYAFKGEIPSGTNRWNIYMDGTADNYMAGALGIGSTTLTGYNVRIGKSLTGSTSMRGIYQESVIQSDVTALAAYNTTYAGTQAAAFTLTNIYHYEAVQGTFRASSAVTNQTGFRVDSSLIGATNNYGFRGLLASGTGRWNLYMDGTANNYLAGNLGIGTTSPSVKLDVSGAGRFINTGGVPALDIRASDANFSLMGLLGNQTGDVNWLLMSGYPNAGDFTIRQSDVVNAITIKKTSGNVGIGTSSPSTALHVIGNGLFSGSLTAGGDILTPTRVAVDTINNYTGGSIPITIQTGGAQAIVLGTSATERMRITSGGKLSIASTATPDAQVGIYAINNNIYNPNIYNGTGSRLEFTCSNITGAFNTIRFAGAGGSHEGLFGTVQNGSGLAEFIWQTYNGASYGERMRITSGGNVGIGTTSPASRLQLGTLASTPTATPETISLGGTFSSSAGSNIKLKIYDDSSATGGMSVSGGQIEVNTWSTGKIAFYRGTTQSAIIDASGNVGIGTSSPSYKLDVVGGINYQNQFNRQTASYTLVLADASKIVETNVGSANNLTVPLNSSVAFPIGTEIAVLQYGSGQTTIVATSGVTLRSKSNALKISGQFAGCTLVKVGTDEWYVVGDLTI